MKNSAHLCVVLVEPRHPGNIGMVCRAMANFGIEDLRLVNPCRHLHPEASKFAVFAKELLGKASLYESLSQALADLHASVAATRRQGRLRGQSIDSTEIPGLLARLPQQGRAGLVFGREDAGLTNAEVALCSHVASISGCSENGSLNLAQAVVALLYELSRRPVASVGEADLPTHREHESLFARMERVLDRIAFLNPSRPDAVMTVLRRMLHRSAPDRQEIAMLNGICSQIEESLHDWPHKRRGDGSRSGKTG